MTPFARELGSLGTGDLTVLAEIGAALGGEGDCWVGDDVVPAADALAAAGLQQVTYGPRDGLAFMSSNAVSIGQAALVFHDASRLLDAALGVAALSYDATDADLAVLDPRVHAARPHRGQVEVARRLRELLGERERRPGPARSTTRSCSAACRRSRGRCSRRSSGSLGVLEVELNVAGENALMLPGDGVALPNGNFHAGVLTLALDSLRGAMAQSASLIAARVSALLDPEVTGLTPQLAQNPGPDSGAMILEYTAHAAAAEVRSLAASAASQTTTVQSGIESHANFAGHSARRTSDALARMSVAVSAELVLVGAGAAAARARAGRARACGGSTRRPPRGSTPKWPIGRFPPTSRPRGSSCSRTHCGWTPSGSRVDAEAMRRRDRIDCASDEIHDLEALRAYPWLRELRLRVASPHGSAEHALTDLSPLAELRELEVFEVPRSRVADLAPLAGLVGLRQLDLSRTRVSDLRPLAGLSGLASLRLAGVAGGGPVAAERPLGAGGARRGGDAGRLARAAARVVAAARARRPRHAGARPHAGRRPPRGPRRGAHRPQRRAVDDLGALRSATALEVLRLGGTRVRDLTPLSGLGALRALSLAGTPVTDVAPLAGLGGLTELNLSRTAVADLAPLSGLAGLEELVLAEAPVDRRRAAGRPRPPARAAAPGHAGRGRRAARRARPAAGPQPLADAGARRRRARRARQPAVDRPVGDRRQPRLRDRAAAAAPGPAGALGHQGDRAAEAAGRALELVREEDEVRAARGELAEVREVLGRDHATAERRPVRRVVVLHEADAARVDAEVADAPLVQVHDRVLAGRGVGAVVAEAVGERAVVAVRPAGAEQDDLARLELAVLGLPRTGRGRR